LVHDPVVAQTERFALDHENQAGLDGSQTRALVLAEKAHALVRIRGGVELPAEGGHVRERRLETLTGAAERRRLFLGDLGVDSPVRLLKSRHRIRATASA
jgi:hypothetical protein